jgi:hypothetical protein
LMTHIPTSSVRMGWHKSCNMPPVVADLWVVKEWNKCKCLLHCVTSAFGNALLRMMKVFWHFIKCWHVMFGGLCVWKVLEVLI